MEIHEVSADDSGAIEELVRFNNAVSEADSPWRHPDTVTTATGWLRDGWDGEPPQMFLARDGGNLVGAAGLWMFEWDNRDLAWLDLAVDPAHRRRGVGSELLDHVLDVARAAGRSKIGADAFESVAAEGFAQRRGFERRSQAINRHQLLAEVDGDVVRKLHDEARQAARAYELVRWVGRTPEGLLDSVAVMTAAINDAPTDDLDIEDEVFAPERIRAYEDACLNRHERLHRLVARHRETGELAGQTVVAVEAERPAIGHQHDTSVVRDHRGHRLGLLLKTEMMLWLAEREPLLETVDTWNAESNDHMIAVNEQLGYRVMGRGLQFQRAL